VVGPLPTLTTDRDLLRERPRRFEGGVVALPRRLRLEPIRAVAAAIKRGPYLEAALMIVRNIAE
jgi:hypothetical protein